MSRSLAGPCPGYQEQDHQVQLPLTDLLAERAADQQDGDQREYRPSTRPESQLPGENPEGDAEGGQRRHVPGKNGVGIIEPREWKHEQD